MLRIHSVKSVEWPLRTRFPFRYGIAAMTDVPYLLLFVDVEFGGRRATGVAADLLPPKWFTKNPETTAEDDDLPAMRRVIAHAGQLATDSGSHRRFFAFWRDLHDGQTDWANRNGLTPLLANFGTSLVERAVLDAVCRAAGATLFQALSSDLLSIDLASLRPSLAGRSVRECLADVPLAAIQIRHTIGLGDALDDSDIPAGERLNDGLPQTLAESIRSYGLSHFKIKLSGDLERDRDRLRRLAAIFQTSISDPETVRLTVDGNENFRSLSEFRQHWAAYQNCPIVGGLLARSLLFVEQPVHRDVALCDSVGVETGDWRDAPPLIIDESDAELGSLPRALELGYSGCSFKNCKGVVKGLANAALLADRRASGQPGILSGEDLANVGPVALHQDLVMTAILGIPHVERNGHHYFAGLSQFPSSVNQSVLRQHPDLYQQHVGKFATLRISSGRIDCGTLFNLPFGIGELTCLQDVGAGR